jgi:hypothetical protein
MMEKERTTPHGGIRSVSDGGVEHSVPSLR